MIANHIPSCLQCSGWQKLVCEDLLSALAGSFCRLLPSGRSAWSTCLRLLVCSNFSIFIGFGFTKDFPCQFLPLGLPEWSNYLVPLVCHALSISIGFGSIEAFLCWFPSTASNLVYFFVAWVGYGG